MVTVYNCKPGGNDGKESSISVKSQIQIEYARSNESGHRQTGLGMMKACFHSATIRDGCMRLMPRQRVNTQY